MSLDNDNLSGKKTDENSFLIYWFDENEQFFTESELEIIEYFKKNIHNIFVVQDEIEYY